MNRCSQCDVLVESEHEEPFVCPLCEESAEAVPSVELWRVWLREYGAAGAIRLAFGHGYTREQILEVNRAARSQP